MLYYIIKCWPTICVPFEVTVTGVKNILKTKFQKNFNNQNFYENTFRFYLDTIIQ